MSRAVLAPVSAISVDGLPVGSAAPLRRRSRLRALPPPRAIDDKQLHLLPGPLYLRGNIVDPVIDVTSRVPWMDAHSVVRSDVIVLVRLGCAIVSSLTLALDDLVRLLRGQGGMVKQRERPRALAALQAGASFVPHGSSVYQMVRAYTEEGNIVILPADWFRGGRGSAGLGGCPARCGGYTGPAPSKAACGVLQMVLKRGLPGLHLKVAAANWPTCPSP